MTPSKIKFYENTAKGYKAQLCLNHCQAVVYLENKNDEVFWKKVLKYACPSKDFYFISESRTPSGHNATGCGQSLLYRNFLDNQFVIGIDSDLRYLKQEPGIDAAHYILQTYTYSFENHLCFANRLSSLPQIVCGLPNTLFDFTQFLIAYSKEIYPLLLFLLYDARQPNSIYSIDDFSKVISIPDMPNKLKNNGKCIIDEIRTRVCADMVRLRSAHPAYVEADEAKRYTPLGLQPANAYLYARGHNLYDLLTRLGKALCEELKNQKKQELQATGQHHKIEALYESKNTFKNECKNTNLHFSYPEIAKCVQDIQSIWP